MSNHSFQRRDGNEDAIEAVFTNAGAWCQHMPREVGFDLLVHGLTPLPLAIEVKSPKGKLTDNEMETRNNIVYSGGVYLVIRYKHQADTLIDMLYRCNCSLPRIGSELMSMGLE